VAADLTFYLGSHQPHWLWEPAADFPLFVSHRALSRCKTLRPSTRGWALDSGGFTELSTYGEWRTTPAAYVQAVARYDREIGKLEWASPMDWMCEPWMIHGGDGAPGTGLSVEEHQRRTVENFLELCELWPSESDTECPFMPVLQGWTIGDYLRCADLYAEAGVRLADWPVVGVGSVCRRQGTIAISNLITMLGPEDLALHGFGVKTRGLIQFGHLLTSADSMAWSYDARRNPPLPGHTHKNCANCLEYASQWRTDLLGQIGRVEPQDALPFQWSAA
jgi:hypothetical protein